MLPNHQDILAEKSENPYLWYRYETDISQSSISFYYTMKLLSHIFISILCLSTFNLAKAQFLNVSGEIRGIPRYPKVGKLPDYEFSCKISIMGMKVLGQDRKIVGTERIQTEAGVLDCYILEETITTKSMMMKDVLNSTMILNTVNW